LKEFTTNDHELVPSVLTRSFNLEAEISNREFVWFVWFVVKKR